MIQIILILVMVVEVALAALVLKNQVRSRQNVYFAIFVISAIFWSFGDALMLYAQQSALIRLGTTLFLAAPIVVALFVLYFATIFPKGKLPRLKTRILLALFPSFLFLIAVIHPTSYMTMIGRSHGENLFVAQKFVYGAYSSYFGAYVTVACILLFARYKKLIGYEKAQAGYALAGFLITEFLSFTTNLVAPLWLANMRYVWAGPITAVIFVIFISVAIVRHHLFDLRLVVARSLGYALAFAILVAGYSAISYVLVNSVVSRFHLISATGVNFILIIFTALTYVPVKNFFDRATNRLFYRDAYDPQSFLDQLNQALVENSNLKKLLSRTSQIIAENIKAEYCLFGINDKGTIKITGTVERTFSEEDIDFVRHITPKLGMNVIVADYLASEHAALRQKLLDNNVAVLVRIAPYSKQAQEGLGYMVLGYKKSGNPYTDQDVRILDIIGKELVIAIQNALHFEEIQNFNKTLQQKVVEATGQLRRTNEKLKALDETKDDFISMASHQLRTPLTSVKGYVSLVLDGDAGSIKKEQRQLLNQAFASSQRMVYLISDLLNVSRLKTGKFIIEPAPVNLADMIGEEIDQLHEMASVKNITLSYTKPRSFPELMFDETKLRQVVMNFADNAIHYTPSGGKVSVELEDKGPTVELRVKDDGIGVPKAEQHHLFTKFYRAGNARKTRPDGTGLGLFMAKKVIIAQGGSLVFESQEGKGSTFGFTFSKSKLAVPTSTPDKF